MKKSDLIKIIREQTKREMKDIIIPLVEQIEAMRLVINTYVLDEQRIVEQTNKPIKKSNMSTIKEILAETEPLEDDLGVYEIEEKSITPIKEILKETVAFEDIKPTKPIDFDSLLNKDYSVILKKSYDKSLETSGAL